jgi:hypothetical protein
LPALRVAPVGFGPMAVPSGLRDRVEHLLDARALSRLRPAMARNRVSQMPSDVSARAVVPLS